MDDIMYNGGVKQRGKHPTNWAALISLLTDLLQFGAFRNGASRALLRHTVFKRYPFSGG